MALAATEIICSLPMSTYTMVLNIKTGLHPWISWADTHYNFNRFEKLPFGWFKLFPRNWILINISRYSLPVGSFIFFIYLGMSGESGQFYRRQFWRLARLLGFLGPSSETSPGASWYVPSLYHLACRILTLPFQDRPTRCQCSITSSKLAAVRHGCFRHLHDQKGNGFHGVVCLRNRKQDQLVHRFTFSATRFQRREGIGSRGRLIATATAVRRSSFERCLITLYYWIMCLISCDGEISETSVAYFEVIIFVSHLFGPS